MLLVGIILIAVLAFLVVLLVIYFDQVKEFFGKKFKKKEASKPKEPSPKVNYEDFIPIKNQYEEPIKDLALEELLYQNTEQTTQNDYAQQTVQEPAMPEKIENNYDDYDSLQELINFNKKKNNKTISQKIKELPPEVKALLIDNALKKRDDV